MRVLLIWWEFPQRPEVLEPFLKISKEGKIEFIHLYFNRQADRTSNLSNFKMIFWFDYKTPFHIIDDIRPDVIFSEFPLDLKTISLRIAAAKRKIPYLAMTHGIIFKNSADITIDNPNSISTIKRYKDYIKILKFYSSVIIKVSKDIRRDMIKYLLVYIRSGYFVACVSVKFQARNPDKYFVFQPKNSFEYYSVLSNIKKEDMVAIGVPFYDDLLCHMNLPSAPPPEKYYLMIDTAWIFQKVLPNDDTINNTYLKLAEYCEKQNAVLKVKLHPHWYDKKDLPSGSNIYYYRNLPPDELNNLLKGASGCFLYFSSLSVPLIVYKKCYMLGFKDLENEMADWKNKNLVDTLDIENFKIEDIDFEKTNEEKEKNLPAFINDYLYSTDGKSVERLKDYLLHFTSGV